MIPAPSVRDGLFSRACAWVIGVPPPDPVARRHAPSVVVLSALGALALVTGESMRWRTGLVATDLLISCLRLSGAAVLANAFWLVRSGRFRAGVTFFVGGAVLISVIGVALTGFAANSRALTELTMPLALAALLLGRRALWISTAAYTLAFAVGGLRDKGYLWGTGPRLPPVMPFGEVGTAIIGFVVVAVVLDRVGSSLREGFELAWVRQCELEDASAELAEKNRELHAEMARRQSAEAQLIEAQKMEAISRLSGGIAHDFNNLLTVIVGATQFARENLPAGSQIAEDLADVSEAANRAAELTRHLLAFARRQPAEAKVLSVDERCYHRPKRNPVPPNSPGPGSEPAVLEIGPVRARGETMTGA